MKKLHWLAILMGAVLLAITGFQVYWLRDNYSREQKAVEVRAQVLFRETVREVQDSMLQNKLRKFLKDTTAITGLKRKSFDGRIGMRQGPRPAARVLHMLGEQLVVDSANRRKGVFITLNSNAEYRNKDSTGAGRPVFDTTQPGVIDEMIVVRSQESGKGLDQRKQVTGDSQTQTTVRSTAGDGNRDSITEINTIYFNTSQGERVKIEFDSLFSEPVSLEELNKAFTKKLDDQQLDIPFTILQGQQAGLRMKKEDFIRRPGPFFENFEGYQLLMGNSFPYLIKKISLPILFSVLLVGLTVLSFVLLYRSLLRQHRLAEMKNDLISNITHELKTPIATVGVAIEALKNFNAMQDPKRTKEYLDISQNELQRLGLLVDKVLKLSMFENKEIEIKKELLDLEEVVDEVVRSLRLQLEKNNAIIQINTEGNLLVRGDRLHLVSVVFNLLDNALKYNKGSVSIGVDIREGNESILLKVTDNGIGIPHQYRHKVFEKFFRVPSGDMHNAKGHGLGLSYVAQVVHQHQGTIKVESEEGHGSSFIIELPKPATDHIGK